VSSSTRDYRGTKIYGGRRGGRLGKLSHVVCDPSGRRVVGFLVDRPDVLLVVRRRDVFVALGALVHRDGGFVVSDRPDAMGDEAFVSLGLDRDACVLPEGMAIVTERGLALGRVRELVFDAADGSIERIVGTENAASHAVNGDFSFPAAYLQAVERDHLVVDERAHDLDTSGGLAAAAGRGIARFGNAASRAAKGAEKAADSGAYKVGAAIGRVRKRMRADGSGVVDVPDEGYIVEYEMPDESEEVATQKASGGDAARARGGLGESAAFAFGRQLGKTKDLLSELREEYRKNAYGDGDDREENE